MKTAFRVLVLVGLMIIIGLQLYNNNLRIAGILERAEREIEAVPVKIYTVKKTSPEVLLMDKIPLFEHLGAVVEG